MSDENNEQRASPTAKPTPDTIGLGRTSGQRGAEILAGLRAEQTPSPVTMALSRFAGRLISRVMVRTMNPAGQAGLNYIPVRTGSMGALVREHLTGQSGKLTILELAVGFSPRGVELALALPDVEVIEVDLPDVIHEKIARLKRARDFTIPPNITWREADLGVVSLSDVLEGKQVHAVTAEGLTPYFPREQQVQISRQVYENLVPGGVFVTDFTTVETRRQVEQAASFFSRQAGHLAGIIEGDEAIKAVMAEAGYSRAEVHQPSDLAPRYNLPTPVANFQVIAVAYK